MKINDITGFAAADSPAASFLSKYNGELLLDGEWIKSKSGEYLDSIDPASGQVISKIAAGNADDVDAAVSSARAAFNSGVWRGMVPAERAKILWKIGELIDEHIDEIAAIETLDQGKPIGVSRWAEIPGAAEQFRFFAGMCSKLDGSQINSSINYQPEGKRVHSYTLREPIGVVGAIVPWNSPLILTAMKVAPALATGCSVVLKPSEDTSLSAIRLGQLCIEAGLPAGVLNIVTGLGNAAGQALTEHKDVNKIAFTGSTATGRKILQAATDNLKKVTLELGGKSPMIVMPDADLEQTAQGVANAAFFNGGQVCVAGTRLYAHNDIAEQLVSKVAEIAGGMSMGHGLDQNVQMGPLVNPNHTNKVRDLVASGVEFFTPTVIDNCNADMRVMREEIFGPVLSCQRFDSRDEVLQLANDSEYGLAASIWTESLSHAHHLAADIHVGTVWINSHLMYDASLPIGGYKESGWGRDSGMQAVDNQRALRSLLFWTQYKYQESNSDGNHPFVKITRRIG